MGTEGHGLVGIMVLGWWLDKVILVVFSKLNDSDSMILWKEMRIMKVVMEQWTNSLWNGSWTSSLPP